MSEERKTTKEIVLDVLKKEKRPLTPKEIQSLTNLNYNTIRGRLQDLKKENLAIRTDAGWIYKEYAAEIKIEAIPKKKRRRKKTK